MMLRETQSYILYDFMGISHDHDLQRRGRPLARSQACRLPIRLRRILCMSLFAAARLPSEILFGKGQRHVLPAIATKYGRRAFVCTDERFAATSQFAEILAGLHNAAIEALVFDRTLPDVPRDSVATCIAEAKGFKPDMVIGIGGGSCLDMAKCAALLLSH